MLKRFALGLLFAPFLFSVFTFSFFSTSPVHAAKCIGHPKDEDEIPINVTPTEPTLDEERLTISFTAIKNASPYRLYINKVGEERKLYKKFTDVEKGAEYEVIINLKADSKLEDAEPGDNYIVQVWYHADGDCGQAGFTIRGKNDPVTVIVFVAPPSTFEHGLTTLPSILVTGVTPGKTYRFDLSGRWGGYIDEKNGREKNFEPITDTIQVQMICENGEANRDDCHDEFRTGDYVIRLVSYPDIQVLAETSFYVEGEPVDPTGVPGLVATDSPDVNTVASGFASTFLSFGVGIAGGIAFLLMVFGAYRLIFAGGNPEAIEQGRTIITAAISGLIIIIFAVFILRFLGFTILGLF